MDLPPGPRSPALWQMLSWTLDPIGFFERSYQQFGDIFTSPIGANFKPFVFVSDPEVLRLILNPSSDFSAPSESNAILKPLIGDSSVGVVEGTKHQRQRKLLMPAFRQDAMRLYAKQISDIISLATDRLIIDREFSARLLMQDISQEIILNLIFGSSGIERFKQLKFKLGKMLDLFQSPLLFLHLFLPVLQIDLGRWSPWGYFCQLRKEVDELIKVEIDSRRSRPETSGLDLLSLLISAKDESGNFNTDTQLRDEILTLLLAGYETTATAMTWAIYWSHYNSEINNRLSEEIKTVSLPEQISSLPYLDAFCKEVLRIYPVGMLTLPRMARTSIELKDRKLPSGTMLIGVIYLVHHRADLYPEPERFNPERFLSRSFSACEYLPFGAGVRHCIGRGLAELEIKLTIATILSRCKLEITEKRPIKPQRRGLILAPSGDLKMVLRKRLNNI